MSNQKLAAWLENKEARTSASPFFESLIKDGPMPNRNGSPTFYALLDECAKIHHQKSHDYANNDNPFGNYHFAGELALLFKHSPKDAGFIGRIGEKIYRLANLESSGKTAINESIEDTERDIVTITLLWIASRREERYGISRQGKSQDSGPKISDQTEGPLPESNKSEANGTEGIAITEYQCGHCCGRFTIEGRGTSTCIYCASSNIKAVWQGIK